MNKKVLVYILLIVFGLRYNSKACSPLNVPGVTTATLIGNFLVLDVTNNCVYTNCPKIIEIEFACLPGVFSSLSSCTFSSPVQSFASMNYVYPTWSVNLSVLCPGTAYQYRLREKVIAGGLTSLWTTTYTLTTPGTFIQPSVVLTSSPALICPPQNIQLNANIVNGCGTSPPTYTWVPAAGLSNPNIANPIASILTATSPATYTCYVTGGPTGCWTASASLLINVGNTPPVPGIASAMPSTVCVYLTSTLTLTSYTGFIQWQYASSPAGPWLSIPGANSPTYVTPSLPSSLCFRSQITSCSGATANSVPACVTTNSMPILSPVIGCSGTLTSITLNNPGPSGPPTSIIWSPAPASSVPSLNTAYYPPTGNVNAFVYFADGCISINNIPLLSPSLTINSSAISCSSLGSATVSPVNIPGPYTFSWQPTAQTGSVATGLFPGMYTITVGYNSGSCVSSSTANFVSLMPYTGVVVHTDSLKCFGASNGTAAISLSNGSGSQTYTWTNGGTSQNTAFAVGLSAGVSTITVKDGLSYCGLTHTFTILQPTPLNLNITASSPTTCAGTGITFTAVNSGGTPSGVGSGYTYTWTGGPANSIYTSVKNTPGYYVFTVNSHDGYNCLATHTVGVDYVPNPVITVSSVSICPLQTGILLAGGATTYTWNAATVSSVTGSTYTDNPISTQQYSVIGSALSCTSMATPSIILKPVPVPIFSSNSPICNGQSLTLSASTATAALWLGPAGYTAVVPNPSIYPAAPNNSGTYQVTVTALNSCTASASGNVTIHPTPALTVSGSTVCVTQVMQLTANSVPGVVFSWNGPNGYSSSLANPFILNPPVSASGNYTIKVTSAQSCTNLSVVHVTVSAMPIISFTSNSPQCAGNTLNFNTAGTSGALLYNWNGPNGFTSTQVNPNISNVTVPASGNYNLSIYNGPCVISASQAVTIHPLPVPLAYNSSPICEGKNLQLGVNNSGIYYQWFGPAGFSSTLQSTGSNSVSIQHSGNYMVTVIDANGCQASSTTSVTVMPNPIVNATGDLVCFGRPAALTAAGANTYLWLGPANYTSIAASAIVPAALNTSVWTYTVIGTSANSCTTVATTTIGTLVLPIPTATATPRVCIDSEIKLQGQGGVTYEWKGPMNYYSPQQNPVIIAENVSMGGNYVLWVTDSQGCKNFTTVSVIIDSRPGGDLAGAKLDDCVPFCSTYSLVASGASSVVSTIWQINNQTFTTNVFSYCFNTAGDYSVTGNFLDQKSCRGIVNYVIKVRAKPEADFVFDPITPIENEDIVMFTNTTKGEQLNKWKWAFIDNDGYKTTEKNCSYMFSDIGTYPVAMVVKNSWGCADTVVKLIEVVADFHVYIPNTFTPNRDGLNDYFFPVMRAVKYYKMDIFDRWGSLVFSTSDPELKWDGEFKNAPCKNDVYQYKIWVLNTKGEEKRYTGSVLLNR